MSDHKCRYKRFSPRRDWNQPPCSHVERHLSQDMEWKDRILSRRQGKGWRAAFLLHPVPGRQLATRWVVVCSVPCQFSKKGKVQGEGSQGPSSLPFCPWLSSDLGECSCLPEKCAGKVFQHWNINRSESWASFCSELISWKVLAGNF